KICRCGLTLKLGVFSLWNGQSAVKFAPAFFSGRYAPMTSTMSLAARMRSRVAGEMPAMFGRRASVVADVNHRLFLWRRRAGVLRLAAGLAGDNQQHGQVVFDARA